MYDREESLEKIKSRSEAISSLMAKLGECKSPRSTQNCLIALELLNRLHLHYLQVISREQNSGKADSFISMYCGYFGGQWSKVKTQLNRLDLDVKKEIAGLVAKVLKEAPEDVRADYRFRCGR